MATQQIDYNLSQSDAQVNVVDNAVSVSIANTSITTVSSEITGTFAGQITVVTSGTIVQGTNVANTNGFFVKGHVDNTDTVWIIPSGATKTSGYPLNAGEQIVVAVANLNQIFFDSDASGGKACWLKA